MNTQALIDVILKPTMELPGVACPKQEVVDEVADDVRFKARKPWALAFSFARAIQQPALEIWQGRQAHVLAAQQVLYHRAMCNRAALCGEYNWCDGERDGRESVPSDVSSLKRVVSAR